MNETAVFLKDYGGHILALIALIQVWVIAIWRNFISKPKATVYPTSRIEIGFSTFGSTVALLGTLRASNGDVFVNKMQVTAIRLRDKAEHIFSWRAFRPNEISIGGSSQNIPLHIASGFLVTPKAPKQYHVFFASESFSDECQSHIQPLKESWLSFIRQGSDSLENQISKALEHPSLVADLFNKFIQNGNATSLFTQISNDFFWRAGDYVLIFTVENDGYSSIIRECPISITENEEKDLRLNTITIVREICGLPTNYNFSYKEYNKASKLSS